jgi:hypothetical protein
MCVVGFVRLGDGYNKTALLVERGTDTVDRNASLDGEP